MKDWLQEKHGPGGLSRPQLCPPPQLHTIAYYGVWHTIHQRLLRTAPSFMNGYYGVVGLVVPVLWSSTEYLVTLHQPSHNHAVSVRVTT